MSRISILSISLLLIPFLATAQTPTRSHAELVWYDEFNDSGAINSAKWDRPEYNRRNNDEGPDGWWSREDSYLDGNGNLVIRVRIIENRNDDDDPHDYSTGALRTKDKFEQRYGRFEARCKLPTQQGWWVAFWMMQGNVGSTANAGVDGSEVDIMEGFGWIDRINLAIHWDGYGSEHQSVGNKLDLPGIRDGYHTYTLDWYPEKYVFYIDGKEIWRTEGGGVCNRPGYVKLTGEISTMEGLSGIYWANDPAGGNYPDSFLVDYVRVYQFPEGQAPFNEFPAPVPGRIEAENFDQGESGSAYFDNTPGNEGDTYRVGDADINVPVEGVYSVSDTEPGEWLAYTVNVEGYGYYDFDIRSSATGGGSVVLEVDGKMVSDTIALPVTGNKQSFITTTTEKIKLPGGERELKLRIIRGDLNIDYLEFRQRDIVFSLEGLTGNATSAEIGQPLNLTINASSIAGNITSIGLFMNNDSVGGTTDSVFFWNFTPTEDDQGWNTFLFSVYDDAGNHFTYPVSFHAGNMLPSISILYPPDSSVIYYGKDMILKTESHDSDGSISSVRLYANGAYQRQSITEPHYFDISLLGRGTHEIVTVAEDNDAGTGADTIMVALADSLITKDGWTLTNADGAASTFKLINDTVRICILLPPAKISDIVLSKMFPLEKEKYKTSIMISAETGTAIDAIVKEKADADTLLFHGTYAIEDADTIVLVYTSEENHPQAILELHPGPSTTGCLYITGLTNEIITSDNKKKFYTDVTIAPNPASDIVYFSEPTNFSIIDLNGKQLVSGENTEIADISCLSSGIYFVNTGNGFLKMVKY
ncbi:MAG: family 16 glycosylhydrolase [Bacteroidales bacterium]|nr:family 16 glycosylhydrolase [Bacteroidales bacterium]